MKNQNIGISDSLFSKVRQRVLTLFYNHPDNDFHTNEIIRLTASGNGAVQRELAALVSSGIILVKQIGNQKRYQVNQSAPIYYELHGIVSKTFGLGDHLRKALKPLSSKIDIAFIYGSTANQTDTARSDIDIMFVSNKISYAEIFKFLEKIEKQLGRKINPTCYTPDEWRLKRKTSNHFIKNVAQKQKIFLIGTEDDLEKS